MRENWQEEKQSAWLYRALAEVERDREKRELFIALGSAAESQADIWREQAQHAGVALPAFRPSLRARIVRALIRALGPRAIRPVLAATKVRGELKGPGTIFIEPGPFDLCCKLLEQR